MLIVLVLISMTLVDSALVEDYQEVNTSYGRVRGQKKIPDYTRIQNGTYIYTYLGIPYAKPPIGELRFRKPEPAEPWNGTLNADKMAPACVQHTSYPYPWFDQEPGQSEDCLYLNIYETLPLTTVYSYMKNELSPVIFVIHGGEFLGGSNRMGYYNGEYFAADWQDNFDLWGAVVVTVNYRLGAFGFLTTNTKQAPGNVGMYDILLALKWVKENIANFNADPNKITLYGTGSGSVAASLFCMSKLAEGLFSRAILHGGTFVSNKENRLKDNLRLSAGLAKAVNCSASEDNYRANPKDAVNCLQGVDANKLAETLDSLNPGALSLFYPQYDGVLFPIDPVCALKSGDFKNIAILLGNSATQGSLILTNRYPEEFGRFGENRNGINVTFAKSILTDTFKYYPDPDEIADHFLNFTSGVRLQWTVRAVTDETTYCPAVYFAERFGDKYQNTWVVEYDYQPPTMPWAKWMGSVQYDDLPYFLGSCFAGEFKNGSDFHKYDEFHISSAFLYRTDIINFARDGNIGIPGWKEVKFGRNNHGHDLLGDSKTTHVTLGVNVQYGRFDSCDYLRKYHGF